MKISKTNAVLIWKQIEDVLVPRLGLSVVERAVYSHLLRHSRLEDRLRLRFSILWLARGNRLSAGSVRLAVRRLVAKGALRLVERTKAGHVVEVRLPGEIRAVRPERGAGGPARLPRTTNLEEMDFLQTKARREAIHSRERSLCFYCLRRLTARVRCLDHVVPQVRRGSNSCRNIVSSCSEWNSQGGCARSKRLRRASSGPRCAVRMQRTTERPYVVQQRYCNLDFDARLPEFFSKPRQGRFY